jgi:hypothetical protein
LGQGHVNGKAGALILLVGGKAERPAMQRVPDGLIVVAQVKCIGLKCGMALQSQSTQE